MIVKEDGKCVLCKIVGVLLTFISLISSQQISQTLPRLLPNLIPSLQLDYTQPSTKRHPKSKMLTHTNTNMITQVVII